jgi:hypothetical protein
VQILNLWLVVLVAASVLLGAFCALGALLRAIFWCAGAFASGHFAICHQLV